MKTILCILLLTASLFAQGLHSNTFTTTGQDPSVNGIISLANTGIGYSKLSWVTTGTVSACAVQLDSSVDGISWTGGGAITTNTCTSAGQTSYISGIFNYVTINVTSLTGGGSVTVTWNGSTFNPGGGGSGVTTWNTRSGDVLPANGDYTKAQVGLGSVQNVDQTVASNITSGALNAARLPVASSTVGQDGIWINGSPLSPAESAVTTNGPTNNTMFALQLNLQRPLVIGHVTLNVTTAGTAETLYVCLYNAAANSLLWSTSGTVNGIALDSFSAAQVTFPPGVYWIGYEQTGSASAVYTAFNTPASLINIGNLNALRFATAANPVSGSACPASLGALTASATTIPAFALEP